MRKCKQRVKAALQVMREHEAALAALDAAREDEQRQEVVGRSDDDNSLKKRRIK